MATVDIDALYKRYGKVEALRGVSVDVADGEFVVLVGPSGCGKSTLLRMIAGLEDISGGTLSIDGRRMNDVEPKHRDIAMVFQNYALYPHMTIHQNMGFSLRLAGRPKAEIDTRVREAARILGLDDYLARYPRELSGGQRQRVAMGRAIVRNPSVFLFDEPLSNLDAKLRVQMRAELKSLHQRLGTTIVYVTHDQVEAMTMADKIVVMRDGIVEQSGQPLKVFDYPANRFVASFIGSPAMNFFEGSIDASGGRPVFRSERGLELPLPDDVMVPNGRGSVVYGVRPEHLEIEEHGSVAATVTLLEPTGSETHVTLDADGETLVALLRHRLHSAPGSRLRLGIDPAHIHLFDGVSGQRLVQR